MCHFPEDTRISAASIAADLLGWASWFWFPISSGRDYVARLRLNSHTALSCVDIPQHPGLLSEVEASLAERAGAGLSINFLAFCLVNSCSNYGCLSSLSYLSSRPHISVVDSDI